MARDLRERLQALGITLGANWQMEGFRNFRGGVRTDQTIAASTLDLDLTFATDRLLHLPEGEFYIDLEDHAGRNPSDVLVGDLQVFDKQNTMRYLQIFEFWYQQKFFRDVLRLKIGKIDANTEFSVITNGLPFINSSTQVSPTVFVFPTTPDPMPGINLFFQPRDPFYASFGAFYSNSSVHFGDLSGRPYEIQPTSNGAFLIGEAGLQWRSLPNLQHGGDLRLGMWGQTGTFTRLGGSRQQGADGFYAILDQTVWKRESGGLNDHGLRMFLEYGQTDPGVSAVFQHFGGGVTESGFLWDRPRDVWGISPQLARISSGLDTPHSYELAVETFYNFFLTPAVSLQPDLQYVINPGGEYSDALVGTLRLKVNL